MEGEDVEVDDSTSLIDESVETEIDESTTEIVDEGDVSVVVINEESDNSGAEFAAINERLDRYENGLIELAQRVDGLYGMVESLAVTDQVQSEAIDEVAETVVEETSAEDDDMPASKRHRWWS